MLILYSLGLLWPLQERHIQNIGLAVIQLSQEFLEIRVPSNAERIIPSSENRVSGLDLEIGLTLVAPESRGRNIPDDIGEVWVQASHFQWESELSDSSAWWVVICLRRILDSVEVRGKVRSTIVQSVALLECNVSSPMADFDIPL